MHRSLLAATLVALLLDCVFAGATLAAEPRGESNGACAAAFPTLVAEARRSRSAQDHLAAADCAAALKKTDEAIEHYQLALQQRNALPREERFEAFKALAYQFEARERWAEAARAWNQALALKDDGEARVGAVRMAIQAGDPLRARQMLAQLEPSRLSPTLQAEYWSIKSQLLKDSAPQEALDAISRAIALEDAPYRRAERADILLKLGRREEAVADLEIAHRGDPSNASMSLSLAYALNE
jgi:tetratricopeptide (TPR) repeat protein